VKNLFKEAKPVGKFYKIYYEFGQFHILKV